MSQIEPNGGGKNPNGEKSGPTQSNPPESSPPQSDTNGKSKETVHRTLQETATMHGMSKSYLSRRVRQKKAAKGYYLRPYANIQNSGDDERIAGFTFPKGYEPSDSRVKEGEPPQTSPPDEDPAGPSPANRASPEETPAQPSYEDSKTEGTGETAALREALAEERARRKEAEEAAAKAQQEKEEWKALARSREEDLRERVDTLDEIANHLRSELGRSQETITALQDELLEWRESVKDRLQEEGTARREAIGKLYEHIEEMAESRRERSEALWDEMEEIAQLEEKRREEAIGALETRLERRLDSLEERVTGLEGGVLEGLTERLGEIGHGFQNAAEKNPEQAAEAANLLIKLVIAYFVPQAIAGPSAETEAQGTEAQQHVESGMGYGEWLTEQMKEEGTGSSEANSPEDSSSGDDPPGGESPSNGEGGGDQNQSGGHKSGGQNQA